MIGNLFALNLKWIIRDKTFQALLAVALLLLFLVPVLSVFSMRQVQELAVTLSLSFISLVLLVLSTLLGASSVWRDIERRYTTAVMTLPASRGDYIWAKFLAIAFFLLASAVILAAVSAVAIIAASAVYPSSVPIQWGKIALAIAGDTGKYILLTAIALFFSSLSTSFFLPFFATLAIFFAGSASQDVFEYVSGEFGTKISLPAQWTVKGVYYLLPNFSAFNLKVQAVYPLPIDYPGLCYTFLYFIIYTALAITGAIWVFSRRELA